MADEAQLDAIARANAFAVYNGITTHHTGDGTAEASLEIGPPEAPAGPTAGSM